MTTSNSQSSNLKLLAKNSDGGRAGLKMIVRRALALLIAFSLAEVALAQVGGSDGFYCKNQYQKIDEYVGQIRELIDGIQPLNSSVRERISRLEFTYNNGSIDERKAVANQYFGDPNYYAYKLVTEAEHQIDALENFRKGRRWEQDRDLLRQIAEFHSSYLKSTEPNNPCMTIKTAVGLQQSLSIFIEHANNYIAEMIASGQGYKIKKNLLIYTNLSAGHYVLSGLATCHLDYLKSLPYESTRIGTGSNSQGR